MTAQQSGGISIYKIPPDRFAPYAKLTGVQVESRAVALRFDAILAATANYVGWGNDSLKVSPLELKRLNLLPSDWQINTAPDSLKDWSIGGLGDNRIMIVLLGFPDVKTIVDRYFGRVDERDCPARSRWDPRSSPSKDRLNKLLIVFDRAQFEAAAAQLKSSPPPEMTTPFLGADSPR